MGGGVEKEKRKIAWVSWDKICMTKEEGGLGIKNLNLFNLALLGKWAWKLVVGGKELWLNILKSKYGDFRENVESNLRGKRHNHLWSDWWRNLVCCVGSSTWFKENCKKKVGNGCNTSFWEENGGHFKELLKIYTHVYLDLRLTRIVE